MATLNKANIPNALTFLRLVLVPVFVLLMLRENFNAAAITFALAAATDAIDGYLARRFSASSRFGAMADPIADKLLMASAYLLLALKGFLPWWLASAVLLRDFFMVAYVMALVCLGRRFTARPLPLGKASTLFQALAALAALLIASGALAQTLFVLTALVTIISGLVYAFREYLDR